MRLTCDRATLQEALRTVERAIPRGRPFPMLQCVLLTAEEGRIHLRGTSIDLTINTTCDAEVSAPGVALIPGHLLSSAVATLPGGVITLGLDKQTLTLRSAGHRMQLNGLDPDEFPSEPDVVSVASITLAAEALVSALRRVQHATAQDESRPGLGGVHLETRDGHLHVAATDEFRLAAVAVPVADVPVLEAIIHRDAVRELVNVFGTGEVTLSVAGSFVRVKGASVTVTARRIEGNYLNYRKIIPNRHMTRVVVARALFQEAVRVANLVGTHLTGKSGCKLYLEIAPSGDNTPARMTVTATGGEMGESETVIEHVEIEGEGLTITLNSKYLGEALAAIATERMELRLNQPLSPMVCVPVDGDQHVEVQAPMYPRD